MTDDIQVHIPCLACKTRVRLNDGDGKVPSFVSIDIGEYPVQVQVYLPVSQIAELVTQLQRYQPDGQ
jgi:hypothetical protein